MSASALTFRKPSIRLPECRTGEVFHNSRARTVLKSARACSASRSCWPAFASCSIFSSKRAESKVSNHARNSPAIRGQSAERLFDVFDRSHDISDQNHVRPSPEVNQRGCFSRKGANAPCPRPPPVAIAARDRHPPTRAPPRAAHLFRFARLPEGARRQRADPHAAARRGLRAFAQSCRRGCGDRQHLRLSRQRETGIARRHRRGDERERSRDCDRVHGRQTR